MKSLTLLSCIAAFSFTVTSSAQVSLVRHNKPVSRIVVTTTESTDSTAAAILQDFIQKSTKAKLPIINGTQAKKIKKGDVLIGNRMSNTPLVSEKLTEDGFLLSTEDGYLRIVSGGDGGSIYGVTTLLERYLDVNYWGPREYSFSTKNDLNIPRIHTIDNPAFRHRQTHFYGIDGEFKDPLYKEFARFEYVNELFAGERMWVHTFLRLVPLNEYAETHPEYYAWVNGKRHTKSTTQLCLTNPDVLEIVSHKIDSIFKAHPERNMTSVSQNDGNGSWCHCEKCMKIIDEEGSVSGLYIRFLNKLAERFPDKQISTLSYLFSVKPPLHVKPLPNVNIMLCNIDCTREVPLNENKKGQEFMSYLEKWSELSNNIFLWDYGINFHNYVAPFPNFHIMAKNMQLFKKNHVNIFFHQMSSAPGEDFAELRTWLTSKLMWNPNADTDELIQTFLKGYYGKTSAPYIYQYIKLMQGALLASNQVLWIYDTPVSFKNSMLNKNLLKQYNELFDKAEQAAATDSAHLARIQRSRLPLRYSDLEIARTEPDFDIEKMSHKLDTFENECIRFNVSNLSERRLYTKDYCRLYRERFLSKKAENLAKHAKVTYLIEPSKRYTKIAPKVLTDGILGGNTFNQCWLGWEGTDGSFVLDLGKEKDISSISIDFLQSLGDWIWPIKGVSYAISTDNKNFQSMGSEKIVGTQQSEPYYEVKHSLQGKHKARYIRIDVEGQKKMPGSGNPSWFFIDEVFVH